MKKLIFLLAVVSFLSSSFAILPHPHGHSIQIQKYEKTDEEVNYEVDFGQLYEFLGHDEIKDRKIVAFSIIGAYRRGKSFFLDYCLRYLYATYKSIDTQDTWTGPKSKWLGLDDEPLTGFSWKAGMTADTKGILFWSDIFLYDAPNGDKIAIIIMDTQGLFEPGVSADFNSRIFGLSTLISSMQVINLNGVIQEDQLQYLEMSVEFTKLANKNQTAQLKPFQDLIFLIRDWADEDTGLGYEGGKVVYDQVFVKSVGNNPAAESVRKNINKAFEKILTFLLPHPGMIVTKKNFDGAYKKLDEEFVDNLKNLIESIFAPRNLVLKKVFGKEITGSEFKNLIVLYFNEFNSNDLPKIESIFEATAKREMEKIATALQQEYTKSINFDMNMEEENFLDKLLQKHQTLKQTAVQKFRETPKMGSGQLEDTMALHISDSIESSYQELMKDVYVRYEDFKKKKEEILKLQNEQIEKEKEIERIKKENAEKLLEQAQAFAEQEKKRTEELERRLLEAQQQKKQKWYRRIFG